jgi:ATP-dependent DNA helicase RecG
MEEDKRKPPRDYMLMAIEAMKESKPEPREDHPSPKVGAVLVFPDGKVEVAHRGELREGDHAEYTLLDKKHRHIPLDGCWIFATLEPCSPGSRHSPKVPCSERIVNARIAKVWFGEEDLALKDDFGGVTFLSKNGIEVEQFDSDLVKKIKKINKPFDDWALWKRNNRIEEESKAPGLLYQQAPNTNINSLSDEALLLYLKKSGLPLEFKSPDFYQELYESDLLEKNQATKELVPTGNAILLFGKSPRNKFPQASVKGKVYYGTGESDVQSFDDALVLIPDQVESWVKKVIPESFDRSSFIREKVPFFPPVVIREAIVNAIIHRDYTIDGAKVQLEIYPEKIIIKSPGLPILPNTLEKLKSFTAKSYSRNKKLTLVFNRMGLMEEAEYGMDTYREMREKYKLPLPIITYDDPYLVVTFPRTAEAVREVSKNDAISELNDEELAGYDFVKTHVVVTKNDYAKHFNFPVKKAQRHLIKFKKLGLVTLEGKGPSSSYKIISNDVESGH